MRTSPALLVSAAALLAATLPAPALAGDGGGVAAPDDPPVKTGGGDYGHKPPQKRHSGPRRRGIVLTSFRVRRSHMYLGGRPARVLFTLSGRRAVQVRLRILSAADRSLVATIDLGERRAGDHSVALSGLDAPEGRYVLHIAGRGLRRAPTASSTAELQFSHHAFPLAGAFDWGGPDARFGARREGHRHQGQDLVAAEGTPVIAPRGGTIEAVQYQARGAGHYVVLDGDDEDYDYVFMHLRTDTILVEEGDHVRTAQQIAEVGTTGTASGPHLHFEIWVGGWYAGGEPVDPLPLLESWAP